MLLLLWICIVAADQMTAAGGEAEVAQSRRAYFDILHQSLVNVSFAMLSQLACCQGCIRHNIQLEMSCASTSRPFKMCRCHKLTVHETTSSQTTQHPMIPHYEQDPQKYYQLCCDHRLTEPMVWLCEPSSSVNFHLNCFSSVRLSDFLETFVWMIWGQGLQS